MDLITQVKKELEEKKEKETKIKIEKMLSIINSKKEQVDKLNRDVKKLEADLEKGDYSELDIKFPFDMSSSTWTMGTIKRLDDGVYTYAIQRT